MNGESKITCKICGEERHLNELKKHIWGKHRVTGKEYLDRFPEENAIMKPEERRIITPPAPAEIPQPAPVPEQKPVQPEMKIYEKPQKTEPIKPVIVPPAVPVQEIFVDELELPEQYAYYRGEDGRYFQRDLIGHGRAVMDGRVYPTVLVMMDDGRIVQPAWLDGFVGVFPDGQEFQEEAGQQSGKQQTKAPEFSTAIES